MATKTKTRSKTRPKAKSKTESRPVGRPKLHDDAALTDKIVTLEGKGLKLGEIAEKLNITTNKVQMLRLIRDLRPKDRIKGTEEEVAAAIAEARDVRNEAWAVIIARTGMSMGKVKRLYTAHTGNVANQGYSVVSRRSGASEVSTNGNGNGNGASAKAKPKAKTTADRKRPAAKRKPAARRSRKAAANPS